LRVDRLWTFPAIAKEFIIIAIAYEATLFVRNQSVLAFGYKPLAHSFKICRIKVAVRRVAIMHFRVGGCQLWLLGVHFSTLVTAH
jgi:hypothetical protein